MNLGDIFFKSAECIIAGSCLLVLLPVLFLWRKKKMRLSTCVGNFLILAPLLSVLGLFLGQHPLFVAWHQAQNTVVPQTGCLSYEPSFGRLLASYRMNRKEFDDWVDQHSCKNPPWKLASCEVPYLTEDMKKLGIEKPEIAYATERAPNGKQLYLLFENDTMYVCYYAM